MARDESDEQGQREEMRRFRLAPEDQSSSRAVPRTYAILDGVALFTAESTELSGCRSDKAVTSNANRKIYPVSQATRNP